MEEKNNINNDEEDKIWDEISEEADPQYVWIYKDYLDGKDCEICKKRHKMILKLSEWDKEGWPNKIECSCKKEECFCELIPLKVFNYKLRNDEEYKQNYGDEERAWKRELFLRNIYERQEVAEKAEKKDPEKAFEIYTQIYYDLRNAGFDSYRLYLDAHIASVWAGRAKKYEEGIGLINDYLSIDKERSQYLGQKEREKFENRKDRYKEKLGILKKDSLSKQPEVTICKKEDAFHISLIDSLKVKSHPNNLILSPDEEKILLFHSGRKQSNILLYDLRNKREIWQKDFITNIKADFYKKFILLIQQTGKIGSGKSKISILNLESNNEKIIFETNNRLSEVVKFNNDLLIGSRDGFLYCLNEIDGLKWRYFVEEKESHMDSNLPEEPSPYEKPCPYHILVRAGNGYILISSFNFIYVLNSNGELRWKWAKKMIPEETKIPLKYKSEDMGNITLKLHMGEYHHIRKIGLLETGPIVAILEGRESSNFFIYFFSTNGKLLESIKLEPESLMGDINISNSGRCIVFSPSNGICFYKDKRQIGIFLKNDQDYFKIICSDDDNYVAAYFYKNLMIFNNARICAEIKFQKEIKTCALANNKLFVFSNKLYIFEMQGKQDS